MLWAMPERRDKVVVVGQGYVGLPLAMRAVEVGYEVVGFEVSEDRVDRLSSADSYVEDVTSGQLAAALATDRYLPTADPTQLAGFDVALITVPTPLKEARPDLSFIEAAGNSVTARRGLTPATLRSGWLVPPKLSQG
jgi:UDP-N-acetyl-D-glucosamine dehydrogenase